MHSWKNLKSRLAALYGLLLILSAGHVFAQGGPPLVTDDPGTPGDGHWEINVGSIGGRTERQWDVDVVHADINYGAGDNVQLKFEVPLTYTHEDGGTSATGLGSENVGVKWRLVDKSDAFPFEISTYPQYLSAWSNASVRKGTASPDDEFFLPVEIATEAGGFELDAEVGRNFVQNEPNQWETGFIAGHECWGAGECLVEIHHTAVANDSQTLLNFGFTWKFRESLILLASAGRDIGPHTPDRQDFVFYLGLQFVR